MSTKQAFAKALEAEFLRLGRHSDWVKNEKARRIQINMILNGKARWTSVEDAAWRRLGLPGQASRAAIMALPDENEAPKMSRQASKDARLRVVIAEDSDGHLRCYASGGVDVLFLNDYTATQTAPPNNPDMRLIQPALPWDRERAKLWRTSALADWKREAALHASRIYGLDEAFIENLGDGPFDTGMSPIEAVEKVGEEFGLTRLDYK